VEGFELSAIYSPEWLRGLTLTPGLSYQFSRIDRSDKNTCNQAALDAHGNGSTCVPGDFYNFDAFNEYADFTHESFPSAPRWQASFDGEYDWRMSEALKAFVGFTVDYTSDTNTFFVNRSPVQPVGPTTPDHPNNALAVGGYTLLDLRAGIDHDQWRFELWGRNVTNTYYWTAADHVNDVLLRYTGMPATYGARISYRY
jgi:hypothetical protein